VIVAGDICDSLATAEQVLSPRRASHLSHIVTALHFCNQAAAERATLSTLCAASLQAFRWQAMNSRP